MSYIFTLKETFEALIESRDLVNC